MNKTTRAQLNRVNREISALTSNTYFDSIPLKELSAILEKHGLESSGLEGIYTGHEGTSKAQVALNAWLLISWYRMSSGRFEIVSYVS
jgi:hypothetical protein